MDEFFPTSTCLLSLVRMPLDSVHLFMACSVDTSAFLSRETLRDPMVFELLYLLLGSCSNDSIERRALLFTDVRAVMVGERGMVELGGRWPLQLGNN